MSAFKQKMARIGARAGLLAGASVAVLAISGLSASSALAVTPCGSGTPANIQGKGSSLQRVAQTVWTGREVPSNTITSLPHTALTGGYAEACPTGTTVSYTSTGSGPGLTAFRFVGSGSIETGGTEPEKGMAFIGTDEAPDSGQITHAQEVAGGAKAVTIPVAETSIGVVIHPPANCKFKSEKGITYANLNAIFAGTVAKWENITNIEATVAGACNIAITRVVRAEGSGTTYQFKNYLATLQSKESAAGLPCSLPGEGGTGTTEWAKIRANEVAGTEGPNTTWPEGALKEKEENCPGVTLTKVVRKAGGGAVAEYVAATSGTIGYAALPDAKGKSAETASLEDTAGIGAKYAAPGVESGTTKKSNCGTRVYTVPTGAESGLSVDWSAVFGASPAVGAELYPLCTLTYDDAWHGYSSAGYTDAGNIAADVKDYIEGYVLASAGQALLEKNWYQEVPSTPTEPTHNVKGAALDASAQIN